MMFHLIQLHFDPDFRFCGTVLLGAGSQARLDSHAQLFADLGSLGGAAVNFACYLGFCLCVHNGIGPYVGIKTSGSISCLYSNLIVEVKATSNHYFAPILRRFGLPMRLVTDTVTVLESSHEGVARQVHCEMIAPTFVFAGIIQASEWRRAGKITTPGKFPGVYAAAPGFRDRDPRAETTYILPYRIPYFEFRCMISSIATGDPFRDFRVVYKTHSGMERVFERKDGKTLDGSDPRLQEPPPFLMARLCMFRAIPLDLEMYNP